MAASSEHEEEEAQLISYMISLLALVVTLLVGHALEKRHIHYLPHSGVGVLVGALCAGLLRWESGFSASRLDNTVLRDERFSASFFMTFLLPPIIFDAGFNIDTPSALRNLFPITFFAFVGTTFSTAVVGLVTYGAGQLGLCYPLSLLAALTFGSLISATDPVSVLSVFKSCGVHEDVFAIVFGESVLNDAVAIVLTRTLLAFNDGSDGGLSLSSRVSYAAFLFVVEFASSLFIGAIFGAGLALLLRHLQLRKPTTAESPHDDDDVVLTVALCFAFPWASYYTAEALECSGIVTLLFCGTVMATYARPHMSADAARVSSAAFKCAGFIAETGVFIYLGEAVFALPILHNTAWRLTLVAMVACALGRAHVPLGVALTNASRRTTHNVQPLPNRELRRDTPLAHLSSGVSVVLWWSGLRGGVAFALASASFGHRDFETHCGGLAMGGQAAHAHGWSRHCSEGSGHAMTDGLAIMQATLLVAATSIFALGGSIERVAEKCGVLKSPTPTTPTYSAVPTRNSRGRLLATTPG